MTTEGPEFTVRKYPAYVPVSLEMALDCGLMTEAEARAQGWAPPPPPAPVPWRRRASWRVAELRERVALAWGVLAGGDIHEDCE
jgi:hypothetical protein